jgi:hypothetical protein
MLCRGQQVARDLRVETAGSRGAHIPDMSHGTLFSDVDAFLHFINFFSVSLPFREDGRKSQV